MSKLICVYCSSSDRLDAKYYAAAEALGRAMAARGWGLVYGGGKVGLMGALARTVKAGGGRVVG
ncbi:MAG TPA: TIGR00730 family Rossman fold protein, partial [Opitutaceae bacterium]|nr:TIGR00730 family Rossman fold protein [Opitutaceae bacterium]